MEHHGLRIVLGQARNDIALAGVHGVACSCHDHTQCCASIPFQFNGVQFFTGGRQHDIHQIAFQTHHDGLGFWVAHAAIEFQCFGQPLRVNHQSSIQEASVGNAVFFHALDGGHDDFPHGPGVHLCSDNWCGRIGTHATGVGTLVTV